MEGRLPLISDFGWLSRANYLDRLQAVAKA